ncbi:MAG: HVA1 family protein [Rhizomicrobium sp.]
MIAATSGRTAPYPFFTIGHSTRSTEEFVDLLAAVKVSTLVDVRTIPRSRANAGYNRDTLPGVLAKFGIGYEHVAELGGLRARNRSKPPSLNAFWVNQSFHNYADYAGTEPFRAGMTRLREIGHGQCCAIMCSEAVWWRCHRRIIADYLLATGETVFHIMGRGKVEPAKLTPAARSSEPGMLIYPREQDNETGMAMTTKFRIGDRVGWNSEAGHVSGTIICIHTRDVDYKGHIHHATPDAPQYEIESDKTDHIAMHKGTALKKLRTKRSIKRTK